MRQSLLKSALPSVLMIFLGTLAVAQTKPIPITITTTLTGANVAPPVKTTGSGTVIAVLVGNELTVTGVYQHLGSLLRGGGVFGGASISVAPIGEGALVEAVTAEQSVRGNPPVMRLTTTRGTSGTFSGVFTLSDEQMQVLEDDLFYVQLYTLRKPDGELRGQLIIDVILTTPNNRPAWYALPDNYDPATPILLLIALHGYSSYSYEVIEWLKIVDAANNAGVLLVAPDGMALPNGHQFWFGTDAFCSGCPFRDDDVVYYLASLIEEAQVAFSIDAQRIYLIGQSNGGFMAHRFACDRSDLVAAIVSVSGATWAEAENCGSPSPVALLQVHGTDDASVSYQGRGQGTRSEVNQGTLRSKRVLLGGRRSTAAAGV